jgi:hypothetical protein
VFLLVIVLADTTMIRLRPALLTALAACLLAPAGASAAPTWTQALAPCYVSVGPEAVQRQVVPIRAAGFTPQSRVDVLVDGAPADTTGDGQPDAVYADPYGLVRGFVRAPYQPEGERPFVVSVTEQTNAANAVSATTKVSALSLALRPPQAAPSRRVRFRGRGFTADGGVWAHYVFGGKVRRTVRLAKRTRGDCGTFSVRRRQIPVTRPRTGRWTLQVDQQKAYAVQPESVFVRLDITVQRVIRSH